MTTRTGSTEKLHAASVKPVPYSVALFGAAAQSAWLLHIWSKTSAGACLAAPATCEDPWGQLVLIVLACAALILLISWKNYHDGHSDASIVDRLWSVQPVAYCWFLAATHPAPPARLIVMTGLATAWGARLTYNFVIKGGYAGGEDYRWAEVRSWYPGWRFELFNVVFICGYQQLLILAFATPAVAAAQSVSPLCALDAVAALLFLSLLALEATADRQMYAFQTEKYRRRGAGEPAGPYARGFIETGVWAYSRHPNYFAEVFLWWSFYLFTVAATGEPCHWSGSGALLLTLLFVPPGASVDVTEHLSSRKYPAYREYVRDVARFVPWVPRRARPEVVGPVARFALLAYFLSHIPITLFIDAQAAVDRRRFPGVATKLLDWHVATNHDFLMGAPPAWFRHVVGGELALQLPFFFVAAKALARRDESAFRVAFLVYGAHVATTMIPILGALAGGDYPTEAHRYRLLLIYAPYLLVPLYIVGAFARAPEPATAPRWTRQQVDAMTVPKLRAALTELGLDVSGLKAALRQRLLDAMKAE